MSQHQQFQQQIPFGSHQQHQQQPLVSEPNSREPDVVVDRLKVYKDAQHAPRFPGGPFLGSSDPLKRKWASLKLHIDHLVTFFGWGAAQEYYMLAFDVDTNLLQGIISSFGNTRLVYESDYRARLEQIWKGLSQVVSGPVQVSQQLHDRQQLKQTADEGPIFFIDRVMKWAQEARVVGLPVTDSEVVFLIVEGFSNRDLQNQVAGFMSDDLPTFLTRAKAQALRYPLATEVPVLPLSTRRPCFTCRSLEHPFFKCPDKHKAHCGKCGQRHLDEFCNCHESLLELSKAFFNAKRALESTSSSKSINAFDVDFDLLH